MAKKILVGIDGSEPAKDAARIGFQMARKFGIDIVALRVVDIDRYASEWGSVRENVQAELESHAAAILKEIADEAAAQGLNVDTQVRHGDSSREIIRLAQEDADIVLILLGATGRRRLGRQMIGSTAERVVRQVGRDLPCPVTIVPSRTTMPEARLGLE